MSSMNIYFDYNIKKPTIRWMLSDIKVSQLEGIPNNTIKQQI